MAQTQRLVTNPKVWAWTKDVHGNVYDISSYITAGRVDRLIDQVSTAELTLRNPEKIFTDPGKGVVFHPMDPITIFLERIEGYPVRVFTGFLDDTPYYQMFPGTIKLKASCTLKRLLYVYFDPALPYFISFLEQFGWTTEGNGTAVNLNEKTETQEKEGQAPGQVTITPENKETQEAIKKAEKTLIPVNSNPGETTTKNKELQDKSIGRLLWGLLYYVAQLRDENIYIENVPEAVSTIIKDLFVGFEEGEKLDEEELASFLKEVIGTSSQGSGGKEEGATASSGNLTDLGKVVQTMEEVANQNNVPPAFVICTSLCECGFQQSEITGFNSDKATGWFQFTSSEPYPGIKVNYPEEARDTAKATDDFCKAVKKFGTMPPEAEWNDFSFEKVQVAGTGGYPEWTQNLAKAKSLISQYGSSSAKQSQKNSEFGPGLEGGAEESQRGATDKSGKTASTRSRLKAMEEEANAITAKHYPYSFGGGHEKVGVPSIHSEQENGGGPEVLGFDCSGSSAAVLAAGGLIPAGSSIGSSSEFGSFQSAGTSPGPAPEGTSPAVTVYYNSAHAFLEINGRYFSTSDSNPRGGAGWRPGTDGQPLATFQSFHYNTRVLNESYNKPAPALTGGGSGTTEEEGSTSATDPLVAGKVAAFTGQIAFPSLIESVTAQLLTGQRALMNDVSLLPFVQQVAQASLRHFQSLPNGDFYAFYPDYFGEMGHHEPYWLIHNLEILEGGINLSDKNLVTHVYAIGDNTWPVVEQFLNEIQSAGTVSIFNAFGANGLVDMDLANNKFNNANTTPVGASKGGPPVSAKVTKAKKGPELAGVMDTKEAQEFLQRYGARPLVMDLPMVRSPLYEMLMAYQGFALGWSRQFITPFRFTFMPELWPGGKVGFPEHGLQMYIESVTHEWDMESGYTTEAQLSAPAVYRGKGSITNDLPEHMVDALVEPIRNQTEINAALAEEKRKEISAGKKVEKETGKIIGQAGKGLKELTNGI